MKTDPYKTVAEHILLDRAKLDAKATKAAMTAPYGGRPHTRDEAVRPREHKIDSIAAGRAS